MTPEQLASDHLFGTPDYVPRCPDLPMGNPRNIEGPRLSWAELVERYRICGATPNRLHGAAINEEGCAI